MKKSQKSSVAVFLLILSGVYAVPGSSEEYLSYCNERYGFCVDYPEHFKMVPAPINNDGRRFYDGSGFAMTASGINNVLENTLQNEMDDQSREFEAVTYRARGKNWFVLSGYKDSGILYVKTYVGKNAINHLYLFYPAHQKAKYARTVERISGSFAPGDIEESH